MFAEIFKSGYFFHKNLLTNIFRCVIILSLSRKNLILKEKSFNVYFYGKKRNC